MIPALRAFLLVICTLSLHVACAQVNWLSWEEAQARRARSPRSIVVNVYADWCTWCKEMDARTYADPEVAAEINANYYAVRLDAERAQTLLYDNRTYTLQQSGKRPTHGLVVKLLGGRIGYPSTVFLDERGSAIQAIPGFQPPEAFRRILRYVSDQGYLRSPWSEFSGSDK